MPTMVSRICPFCKKRFLVAVKRVNAGQGIYCSRSCNGKSGRRKTSWVLIPLTKGLFSKISVEDVERVCKYKWFATKTTYGSYRASATINNKQVRLHRFILNAPDNMDVDHINHDTLDNRREKIRICTRSENLKNRRINGGD